MNLYDANTDGKIELGAFLPPEKKFINQVEYTKIMSERTLNYVRENAFPLRFFFI